MKMEFVDDVKGIWRHYSTVALGLAGSIQTGWVITPESIKADLPKSVGEWVAKITVTIIALGLIGKVVKQGNTTKDASTKDAP